MYESVVVIFPDPALVFAAAALDNLSVRVSFALDVISRSDGDERNDFLPTPLLPPIDDEGDDELESRLRPSSTFRITFAGRGRCRAEPNMI